MQSVDGYVSGRGIEFCAEVLDLTTAEVSGVATFYTQYKRHPNGDYTVGVCTNTLCAIMGGDEIWESVSDHLGIGHDETTADGRITLERIECNAACDYAPVVMANWEFFDNQTPESTNQLVDDLRCRRGPWCRPAVRHGCATSSRSRGCSPASPTGAPTRAPAPAPPPCRACGWPASAAGPRRARRRAPTAPTPGPTTPTPRAAAPTPPRAPPAPVASQPGRHSSTDSPANDPDETPAGGEDKA